MKKRLLSICILISLIFIFTACSKNNNTTLNKENDKEKTESSKEILELEDSEVTNEDILYYYEAYTYIQDFYKGFYFVTDAIEDVDKDLFDNYLLIMKEAENNIVEMKVPSKYEASHEYLIDSMKEYLDGINKLYDSYDNCDMTEYLNASEILVNAESTLDAYITLIYKDFEEISSLFSALLQNEYYMDLIDIYTYEEQFTDDENDDLFKLERLVKKFANLKNDLLFNVCKNESISTSKKALENNLENIKDLEIENDDIRAYRDSIVIEIEEYVNIILELSDLMNKSFDNEKILNLTERSNELNYNIYNSLKPISDFYESYGIDIGFSNTSQNIESTLNSLEN